MKKLSKNVKKLEKKEKKRIRKFPKKERVLSYNTPSKSNNEI